jgi:Heliorhodopsin
MKMKEDKSKLAELWQLFALAAGAYLVLGIVAIVAMDKATFPVITSFWTNNDLASQSNTVFATGVHNLFYVQFRWALVVLMTLSLVVPLGFINLVKKNLSARAAQQLHKWRWLDWAVTGTFMLLIISALASVQDLMTMVLIAGLSLSSYFFIWFSVRSLENNPELSRSSMIAGVLGGALPWLLILVYALGTGIFGSIRSPWFVYFLYFVGLVNLAIVLISNWLYQQRLRKKFDELTLERGYLIANQLIKIVFALALIFGLKR